MAGQDALARRPTILLALALKYATDSQRTLLEELFADDASDQNSEERVEQLREILRSCGVFEKADTLVERCRERAVALVEEVDSQPIRDLLQFFLETVLSTDTGPTPAEHLDPSEPVFANLQIPPAPVIQLGIPAL